MAKQSGKMTSNTDFYRDLGLKDLVMVPTHAGYVGSKKEDIAADGCWLKGFPGEGRYYAQHVEAGVQIARANPDALLMFSGGQTVRDHPFAESQGYYTLAIQMGWLNETSLRKRVVTEEFARDSFETLQFGVERFVQVIGRNPSTITIPAWGFKEERYKLHAEALGINWDDVRHISVNNPDGYPNITNPETGKKTAYGRAVGGEEKTIAAFEECPMGDEGELLAKRLARDPFCRGNPYHT